MVNGKMIDLCVVLLVKNKHQIEKNQVNDDWWAECLRTKIQTTSTDYHYNFLSISFQQ